MCFTAVSGQAIYFLKCQRNATQKFKKFSPRVVRGTVCLTLVFFSHPLSTHILEERVQNMFQLFSLVIKTKVVQNVNRMSEKYKDSRTDRQTDRQIDRQTDRQIFQLSYQNKSCSECQQDVKKSVRQTGRYAVRQADRVTERQNGRMTVWQNSRAAKEPALVLIKIAKMFLLLLNSGVYKRQFRCNKCLNVQF